MNADGILHQILTERMRQDGQWGGPEHDDQHTNADWIMFIIRFVGKAAHWPFDYFAFRKALIQAAALCVAAIEWADRREARQDAAVAEMTRLTEAMGRRDD